MKKITKPVLLSLVLLCNLVEQSNGMSAVEPISDGVLGLDDESYEFIGAGGATFDGNPDEGLMAAARLGEADLVQFFLRKKANPDVKDREGQTPLMHASLLGKVKVVTQLLAARADVNAQDRDGDTALMKASLNGNIEVVNLLLNADAIPTARNRNGIDAMEMAGMMNHNDVVQLLTEAIKAIEKRQNTKFDESLDQPLIAAVRAGNVDLVHDLLQRRANPNAVGVKGRTALMSASYLGWVKIVKLLFAAGASTVLRDRNGWMPIDFARFQKHEDVEQLLIARFANEYPGLFKILNHCKLIAEYAGN